MNADKTRLTTPGKERILGLILLAECLESTLVREQSFPIHRATWSTAGTLINLCKNIECVSETLESTLFGRLTKTSKFSSGHSVVIAIRNGAVPGAVKSKLAIISSGAGLAQLDLNSPILNPRLPVWVPTLLLPGTIPAASLMLGLCAYGGIGRHATLRW